MTTPEATLSIQDLADRAEVSRRAIRYYIQRGLLASPQGRGRGSRYTQAHLETLLWLKRAQLDGYTLDQIERGVVKRESSLSDLSALAEPLPSPNSSSAVATSKGPTNATERVLASGDDLQTAEHSETAPETTPKKTTPSEQWTRYRISPDIELSIRDRSLSPQDQDALARHLIAALAHLTGDTP